MPAAHWRYAVADPDHAAQQGFSAHLSAKSGQRPARASGGGGPCGANRRRLCTSRRVGRVALRVAQWPGCAKHGGPPRRGRPIRRPDRRGRLPVSRLGGAVSARRAAELRPTMTVMGWKTTAVFAAAIAAAPIAPMAPARGDGPAVGSGCVSGQLNQTTVSSAGTTVRCLADQGRGYIWQVDRGVKQAPSDADRIARQACQRLGQASAECSSAVDKAPYG